VPAPRVQVEHTDISVSHRGNIDVHVFGDEIPSKFDPQLLIDAMSEAVKALPNGSEPGPTKIDFGHWRRSNNVVPVWFCRISMDFILQEHTDSPA
jgi:hypothetical protein